MHTEERPWEAEWEDGHLQAKGRGLNRNLICRHCDLGLPAFITMKKYTSISQSAKLVILGYGSPRKLTGGICIFKMFCKWSLCTLKWKNHSLWVWENESDLNPLCLFNLLEQRIEMIHHKGLKRWRGERKFKSTNPHWVSAKLGPGLGEFYLVFSSKKNQELSRCQVLAQHWGAQLPGHSISATLLDSARGTQCCLLYPHK